MDFLDKLSKANEQRCPEFGHGGIKGWNLVEWGLAVAGETGEMCNLIKKHHRGDAGIHPADIAKEAADVVIYLDMLMQRMGQNLQDAVIYKFNEKSMEIGSPVMLGPVAVKIPELRSSPVHTESGAPGGKEYIITYIDPMDHGHRTFQAMECQSIFSAVAQLNSQEQDRVGEILSITLMF